MQALQPGEANLIPTDVTLVLDPRYRRVVERFARDESQFFAEFRKAYVKLVHVGFAET